MFYPFIKRISIASRYLVCLFIIPANIVRITFFLLCFSSYTLSQVTERIYLSGSDKDHTVEWDFFITEGRNSGKWSKIPVPSNWEMQGFGIYTPGWNRTSEKGMYKHEFYAEPAWQEQRVFIVFEGSMTDTEVRINGQLVGPMHQGGFYRFSYNIGQLLNYGSGNLLEVTVSKSSQNESVNRAEVDGDYWSFGGIFRPVYLEIVPPVCIDRIAINARHDGALTVEVFTANINEGYRLSAQVKSIDGTPVGEPFLTASGENENKFVLSNHFAGIKQWSPEFPNLYLLEVSILNKKKTINTLTKRFGFRTVELREQDGLYINNQKVLFKGINRHSCWPESGRTLGRRVHLLDIQLIKDMNMNAVRMSHYPPDEEFLDLCDSLGLFVLDELAGWQKKYDTEVAEKLVREMVTRDVNHPSIVLWCNGNEGGWNRDVDDDYHLYDPQKRPVIHPWENYGATDTKHYPDYNYVQNSVLYGDKLFFPTEFMHGLYDGGHGAGLHDFWSLMMQHPHMAGGFLWVFADEGIVRDDQEGRIDVNPNYYPDGIVGPYREKEGSFFAVKEIWSPIFIDQKKIVGTFSGLLSVENRFLFTNLNQCTFTYDLVYFPLPDDSVTDPQVVFSGNPEPLSLEPGEKGFLNLNLPNNWQVADALYLTACDPHGRDIFTWTWPLHHPQEIVKNNIQNNPVPAEISENDSIIVVQQDLNEYYFSKHTGYLLKVTNEKSIHLLSHGPIQAGMVHRLKNITCSKEQDKILITCDYEGSSFYRAQWTFQPGYLPLLECIYNQEGEADYMGIMFNYPEKDILSMKWLGRGPYRVWKNRMSGMEFGVWQKEYNNTVTGESWIYPEFKGYHSELYWVKVETRNGPLTIYSGTDNLFLQMLKPDEPQHVTNMYNSPPFPEGELGFMNAIPPIGTKFQHASALGPQGAKNILMNYIPNKITLWFDFR